MFYERHVAVIAAYVGRRVVRGDLTFDVVTETFARALEDSPQLPAEEAIRQARETMRLRGDLARVLCALQARGDRGKRL